MHKYKERLFLSMYVLVTHSQMYHLVFYVKRFVFQDLSYKSKFFINKIFLPISDELKIRCLPMCASFNLIMSHVTYPKFFLISIIFQISPNHGSRRSDVPAENILGANRGYNNHH